MDNPPLEQQIESYLAEQLTKELSEEEIELMQKKVQAIRTLAPKPPKKK